jgi:hypothetical protein
MPKNVQRVKAVPDGEVVFQGMTKSGHIRVPWFKRVLQ